MKITVKWSFLLYLLAVAALSSWQSCLSLLCALLAHELGHYLVVKLIKEPVERVEIAPFGGVMVYRAGYTPSKGIRGLALALAGPAGNYLTICLLSSCASGEHTEIIRQIITVNLSMMLFNLLPALPLDGGAALFSVGYYLFEVSKLIAALSVLGILAGILLCILCLLGTVYWQIFNLSLAVVGGYLIVTALGCRQRMLADNLHTVIRERLSDDRKLRPVKLYRTTGEEQLYTLVPCIGGTQACMFMIEMETGTIAWLGERIVCRALLDEPYARVKDIIRKNQIE